MKALVDFQALKTPDLGAEREPPENHAKVREPVKIRPKSVCRIKFGLIVLAYMFVASLVVMAVFSLRSIHRLTQLERLDLGSNEFSDVVRLLDVII